MIEFVSDVESPLKNVSLSLALIERSKRVNNNISPPEGRQHSFADAVLRGSLMTCHTLMTLPLLGVVALVESVVMAVVGVGFHLLGLIPFDEREELQYLGREFLGNAFDTGKKGLFNLFGSIVVPFFVAWEILDIAREGKYTHKRSLLDTLTRVTSNPNSWIHKPHTGVSKLNLDRIGNLSSFDKTERGWPVVARFDLALRVCIGGGAHLIGTPVLVVSYLVEGLFRAVVGSGVSLLGLLPLERKDELAQIGTALLGSSLSCLKESGGVLKNGGVYFGKTLKNVGYYLWDTKMCLTVQDGHVRDDPYIYSSDDSAEDL